MTIVPLILSPHPKRIGRHRSHRLGRSFSSGGGCRSTKGEGRPRLQVRAQGGAASRARGCLPVVAPRCGCGLPLGAGRPRRPPAGRRARVGRRRWLPAAAHQRRLPVGPGGARPRVVFFLWPPGFVAAGAGGRLWCLAAAPSGAWQHVSVYACSSP